METSNTTNTQPEGGGQKAIWIIVVIIVIGLMAFFAMRGTKTSENDEDVKSDTGLSLPTKEQPSAKSQTLNELLTSGVSQVCDFIYQDSGIQSSGKVYIANGKMRNEFSSTVNGQQTKTSMISDGQTVYTWIDGQTTGFKMLASTMADNTAIKTDATQKNVDPNTKYDYNCSQGTIDENAFKLPDGVNFTDMSAMMQNQTGTDTAGSAGSATGAESPASIKAQQCSACDSLSGEQKIQCLVALQCQ